MCLIPHKSRNTVKIQINFQLLTVSGYRLIDLFSSFFFLVFFFTIMTFYSFPPFFLHFSLSPSLLFLLLSFISIPFALLLSPFPCIFSPFLIFSPSSSPPTFFFHLPYFSSSFLFFFMAACFPSLSFYFLPFTHISTFCSFLLLFCFSFILHFFSSSFHLFSSSHYSFLCFFLFLHLVLFTHCRTLIIFSFLFSFLI